jgi:hypothetical protein
MWKFFLGCAVVIFILWVANLVKDRYSSKSVKQSAKVASVSPEPVVLDDRGNTACVDFKKLGSEGEQSLAGPVMMQAILLRAFRRSQQTALLSFREPEGEA